MTNKETVGTTMLINNIIRVSTEATVIDEAYNDAGYLDERRKEEAIEFMRNNGTDLKSINLID